LRLPWPASEAYSAPRRVRSLALPFLGGGRSTPARRASERPMAIACLGDLTPCSPRRTFSISARTNSPAWVLGDLPARLSARAFSIVCLSGIGATLVKISHDSRKRWDGRSVPGGARPPPVPPKARGLADFSSRRAACP